MYAEPITSPGGGPAVPAPTELVSEPASLVPLRAVVGSASVLWACYTKLRRA